MNDEAYRSMCNQEDINWYYQARLMIIESLIRRYVVSSSESLKMIVDVGCGTGGTSVALSKYGNVVGVEPSLIAVDLLKSKLPDLDVIQGTIDDLPSLIGLATANLVTALGVLCHRNVDDPKSALQNIAETLCPGGWFLWGDCVYPILWRHHDDFVHCGRRFYPSEMHRMLQESGFEIVHSSHLLSWGFPVALGLAVLYRIRNFFYSANERIIRDFKNTDDRPLPPLLNFALRNLTYCEWKIGSLGLKAPVGVSRLILARKRR